MEHLENNQERKDLTQQQLIRAKIKELKELENIEKKIAKLELDKQKLITKRKELERKYGF